MQASLNHPHKYESTDGVIKAIAGNNRIRTSRARKCTAISFYFCDGWSVFKNVDIFIFNLKSYYAFLILCVCNFAIDLKHLDEIMTLQNLYRTDKLSRKSVVNRHTRKRINKNRGKTIKHILYSTILVK